MSGETVVGWNGSAAAGNAAEWALERAARAEQPLRIVQVVSNLEAEQDPGLVDATTRALDDEKARLQLRHPGADIRCDVVVGDAVEQLRALSVPSRLLVIGTDERLRPKRTSGWSIGARLASSCPGAVAVVPLQEAEAERHGIVAGVEMSERDSATISFAAREAIMSGQTLHLVHAWRRPSPFAVKGLNPDYSSWLEEDHRKELAAVGDRVAREFPAASIQLHLSEGSASHALHGFASSATALVVGTRGRGPIRRILLGSTSHALLLYIDAPTIIVPRSAIG